MSDSTRKRTVPELLAPAGGPAEFNAAIAAGADAIYCGFGNTFNARRGAQSFTSETFREACRRAHLAGTRVYVTVNVVIRDDELPTALALVRRAWLLGADAFIIQDWGLLSQVRRLWPEVECHMSTQANVHDVPGVLWARGQGVSRVTLSRELSLPELRGLAQTGVELETFGHGALCFSYSGICQMSACAGNRSANRGACAQPCRLPYELVDQDGKPLSAPDRGRPLCPKDCCTIDCLSELADTGVASLKVEGRLKSSDYVYAVISAYRAQLDDLAAGRTPSDEESARRHTQLKRAFNRDFTSAYLWGRSGDELMSYERSNNRGELVGEVVGSRSLGKVKVRRGGAGGGRERLRNATVADVDVRLDKPIGKGDLLELRPLSDPSQFLTAHAPADVPAGETVSVRTVRTVENGSLARVIRSQEALDRGERAEAMDVPRRRPVHVRVRARLGEPFVVTLATTDGSACATATGFVVEEARTRAVSADDVAKHVGRMGSTWFDPVDIDVELDEGCGMPFSAVHAVRADACAALEQELLAPFAGRELAPAPSREDLVLALAEQRVDLQTMTSAGASVSAPGHTPTTFDGLVHTHLSAPEVCALVADADSAHAALEAGATRLYATADALSQGEWPEGVVPLLDEVCREPDHERLFAHIWEGRPIAAGNVSELAVAAERGARPEVRGCIPVHNESALVALERAGATGVWASPELSLEEIGLLTRRSDVPFGLVVYGRTRAMTSEHCVLQVANRCVGDCARCELRRHEACLRRDDGGLMPVRTDLQGRSRIYAAQVLDVVPELAQVLDAGVTRLGVDCTLLDADQTAAAVRRVVQALSGSRPARVANATTGHLFDPVA